MDELDEKVNRCRDALSLHPPSHPQRSDSLENLGDALWDRYKCTWKTDDLDDAIACSQEALQLRPGNHPRRSISLCDLGIYLHERFDRSGGLDNLEEAISSYCAALDLRPIGHPNRSSSLLNLANALITRFGHIGQTMDLDECIPLYYQSLALLPTGHPNRSLSLMNLATALWTRFNQSGQRRDLDECIPLYRQSLELRPIGHPNRSSSLLNLANALSTRFEHSGKKEDLDECILLYHQSLDLLPYGHPERSMSLMNLASALKVRFLQIGQRNDLEECIHLYRESLDLRPIGHPFRAMSLENLASVLLIQFEQSGQKEYLEEIIPLYRQSVDLLPTGYPLRFGSLMNLANALLTRFWHNGQKKDLDECLPLYRQSLDHCPTGNPKRSMLLRNLANALLTQSEQSGQREDLEDCIPLFRESLDVLPTGHSNRSASLSSLANALLARFEHSGQKEDLDECILLYHQSLDLLPYGHPGRSMPLTNLAIALKTRFFQSGSEKDLDECISLHRQSVDLLPTGHSLRSKLLVNLADAILVRCQKSGQEEELEEAIKLLKSSTDLKMSNSLDRLRSASRWVEVARSYKHSTALDAYRVALNLLEHSLSVAPTLIMQHELLNGGNGYPTLAVDAASYAIERGDLAKAVELLEQGRALLWSQMRGFRTPISRLAEVNKEIADRFLVVSSQLETLATGTPSKTRIVESILVSSFATSFEVGQRNFDEMMSLRRRLSEEQEEIIEKIRGLSSFEDFLRATPFDILKSAAEEGPVIIINHSKYRSDCIIVLKDSEPVCIPLPELLYAEAQDRIKQLRDARKLLRSEPKAYDDALRSLLGWLWRDVVSFVVNKFEDLGVMKQSRVWWYPTSILSAFPFHAAGPYLNDNNKKRHFLDDFVPSYTPTLKALIAARAALTSLENINHPPSLLVIGCPGEIQPPPMVPVEVNIIRKRAATCLEDKEATKEAVLDHLLCNNWVHFACHGHLKQGDPFNSSFQLHDDERLTLLDIVENKLPNAELAFLSACHSAAQATDSVQDEMLHLAAGMQFCGFRSVIGTMWAMSDEDGPFMVEQFYKRMFSKKTESKDRYRNSARALQKAVLLLRSRSVDIEMERWVNFIHIGA